MLIEDLIKQAGGKAWNRVDFADVSYFHKQFVPVDREEDESVAAFRWVNGKLIGLAINGDERKTQEYSYVHLQKRKMAHVDRLEDNDFLITPSGFIAYTDRWMDFVQEWLQPDAKFERNAMISNRRNQFKNLREGAVIFRMKRTYDKYFG